MKIVFLDSLSLGGQELSRFKKFGEFIEYQTTSSEELANRIADAEIIITNKVIMGEKEFLYAPKLKLICICATGVNNIDISAARKKGIAVINVKDYSTESVAQMTLTFMLNLSSSFSSYNELIKSGAWPKSPIFTMLNYPFFNLKGKTLGIIGYGAIGKRVEELTKVFGMNILVSQRPRTQEQVEGRVSFERVLMESDFITVHAPLNENTENLFDLAAFKLMKKTSFLINTARGPIVVEEDLAQALKEGLISGAAIDVMKKEPPSKENPLFDAPNLIITPHMAWASKESIETLLLGVEKNINDFLNGTLEGL